MNDQDFHSDEHQLSENHENDKSEMEKLRELVRELEYQNRILLARQQHQSRVEHVSIATSHHNTVMTDSNHFDNFSTMSRLGNAQMDSSTMADDTCSVLSLSMTASQIFSQPSHAARFQLPGKVQVPSHKQNGESTPSHSSTAEDCWLYRPAQEGWMRNSLENMSAEVTQSKLRAESDTCQQWVREVFDVPQRTKQRPQVQYKDTLVRKLEDLRLTGRVTRWASSMGLSSSDTAPARQNGNEPNMVEETVSTQRLKETEKVLSPPSNTSPVPSTFLLHSSLNQSSPSPPIKPPLLPMPEVTRQPPKQPPSRISHPQDVSKRNTNRLPESKNVSPPLATSDVLEIARKQQESLREYHRQVIQQKSRVYENSPSREEGRQVKVRNVQPSTLKHEPLPLSRRVYRTGPPTEQNSTSTRSAKPSATPVYSGIVHEEFV